MDIVLKNEPTVWLSYKLFLEIFQQDFAHCPNETGGILMGRKTKSCFLISHIIGPGPKAIHNKSSFIPDNDYHTKEIENIHRETSGMIEYLGDWHTHPGEEAYLSRRDKTTLKTIAEYEPARLPEPLMMILGTYPFELKCWRYKHTRFGAAINQQLIVCVRNEVSFC